MPVLIRSFALSLIHAYQRWLSPLLGTRCRFHPSCSRYMATAIQRFGSARGLLLGSCRLLRCQPFNEGGFDAVPDRFPIRFWRRNPDRSPPPLAETSGDFAETSCCHHPK